MFLEFSVHLEVCIFLKLEWLNQKRLLSYFSHSVIIHTAEANWVVVVIISSLSLAYHRLISHHLYFENVKYLLFPLKLENTKDVQSDSLSGISEIQDSMEEIFYIYASLCNNSGKLLQKLDFLFIAY